LLLEAEEGKGGEVLRFWEWPDPAVVLGASGMLQAEVDAEPCEHDGVPILRRASGGGTVLLGEGCLLFSLILRFDRDPALKDVNASYRHILDRISHALRSIAALEFAGTCDLASAGRKCSGNAQQRKRDHVLHHGTLLYRFDRGLIGRYLRLPDRQPTYRARRAHEAFVTNLPAEPEELQRLIAMEWNAGRSFPNPPMARVAELIAEKYGSDEWNRRR
jgi:lipoate-protein ligase A